ncbi:MAG: hypothetical protein AB2L24_31065 [Mangrovibacterium sp.]
MIDGKDYVDTVKKYYSFLNTEFNMSITDEKVRGNAFYDVQYGDKTKVISINYENIEDYFQVTIFKLQNGKMPDYDDKTKTLHLNKLNAAVISKADKSEINLNNEYFVKFNAKDELERKLLKSAKELRLCLKHLNEL